MMIQTRQPIALISAFVWVGFVCAISFLEAWLKFRAPGVTLPIGLGIGRLVFGALNKVEWILAIVVLIDLALQRPERRTALWITLPVLALVAQTVWILPALDSRAESIMHGGTPAPSDLHFVFVTFEVIKVAGLVLFGTLLFQPVQVPITNPHIPEFR